MEDVRLGRKTVANDYAVSVQATLTPFVPAMAERVALIISPALGTNLFLTRSQAGTAGQGICIPSGGDPLVLDIQHHGSLVTGAWYASVTAGPVTVTYADSILAEK